MSARDTQASMTVVNTDFITGKEIASTLGVVFAQGVGSFGTARNRSSDALAVAWQNLQHEAHEMGADAVINLQVTSSGIRGFLGVLGSSSVLTLTGTAVELQ